MNLFRTDEDAKAEALAKLEARMGSGEPFTYGDLCTIMRNAMVDENRTRLADRAIQRWRKVGRITCRREGRTSVWTLAEASQ